MSEPQAALAELLLSCAREIRADEAAAQAAVSSDRYEPSAHAAHLRTKCLHLMALPDSAEDALTCLAEADPETAERISDALESMAGRAAQAVSMGSIFYMANLLYPETYTEGEPNELERLADTLTA